MLKGWKLGEENHTWMLGVAETFHQGWLSPLQGAADCTQPWTLGHVGNFKREGLGGKHIQGDRKGLNRANGLQKTIHAPGRQERIWLVVKMGGVKVGGPAGSGKKQGKLASCASLGSSIHLE